MTLSARFLAWAERPRDAFGRLLADPSTLTREQRLQQLREVGQALAASPHPAERFLGTAIARWLAGEAPTLESALLVMVPRGSHRTAAAIARQAQTDAELVEFAVQVGGARRAAAVLRGEAPCPAGVRLPDAGPVSEAAIRRARRRSEETGQRRLRRDMGDEATQRMVAP